MSTTTIVKSGNQIINITTNELNQKLVSVSQAANESSTSVLTQLDVGRPTTTTASTLHSETSTESSSSSSPPTTSLTCDLLGDTNGSFNSNSLTADAALGFSSNAYILYEIV